MGISLVIAEAAIMLSDNLSFDPVLIFIADSLLHLSMFSMVIESKKVLIISIELYL